MIMITTRYRVLSPDGFDVEMNGRYRSLKSANAALDNFVKCYEVQGYYSTISNGERVRLPISQIKESCDIIPVN